MIYYFRTKYHGKKFTLNNNNKRYNYNTIALNKKMFSVYQNSEQIYTFFSSVFEIEYFSLSV